MNFFPETTALSTDVPGLRRATPDLTAVTPMQVVQGIEAVVSILNALSGMRDANSGRVVLLCEEINAKVNVLIGLQIKILEELRELRVYFAETLRKEFITALDVSLRTLIDLVNVTTRMWKRAQTVEELDQVAKNFENIWESAQKVILELEKYGPAVYQTIGSGYALIRAVHEGRRRFANSAAKRRVVDSSEKSYLEELLTKYEPWLDPANPNSVAASLIAVSAEFRRLVAEIEAQPKRINGIGERRVPQERFTGTGRGGGRSCYWDLVYRHDLIIYGSFEDGFTDEIAEAFVGKSPEVCEIREPVGPRDGGRDLLVTFLGEQGWADYQAYLKTPVAADRTEPDPELTPDLALVIHARARDIVGAVLPQVAASRSPLIATHAITQTLNAKRAAALKLAETRAALEEVIKNVTLIRDDMKRRIAEINV